MIHSFLLQEPKVFVETKVFISLALISGWDFSQLTVTLEGQDEKTF